jgi:hypothetical protein
MPCSRRAVIFSESDSCTPRIVFVAAAELCDQKWGRQLTAQVRELSAYGCDGGTPNTQPVANTVLLKIFAQSECFEAMTKVIYTHRNRGMGLIFQELSLQSGNPLRQRLLKSFSERVELLRRVPLNTRLGLSSAFSIRHAARLRSVMTFAIHSPPYSQKRDLPSICSRFWRIRQRKQI